MDEAFAKARRNTILLEEAAKDMYEVWRTGETSVNRYLDWNQAPEAHDFWMIMARTAFSKFQGASNDPQ